MDLKKLSSIIFFIVTLFGCAKDDLEGSELQPNPFAEQNKPLFEITAKQYADCSVIFMDVDVLEENLPDTLIYSHLRVQDPFGHTFITEKRTRIATSSQCNQSNEYKVSLYNKEPERVSRAQTFIFQ